MGIAGRRGNFRVAEQALHGDDIDPGPYQACRKRVSEVVKTNVGNAGATDGFEKTHFVISHPLRWISVAGKHKRRALLARQDRQQGVDRAIHGNRPVASFGLRVEDSGRSLLRVSLGCRNAPEPGRGGPFGSRKNGAPGPCVVRHGTQILF
jgi:hypothetical protein